MTWTETLQSAGFPIEVLFLDFETYFDSEYHLGRDKKALSTIEYITDPRFEFTGLGAQAFNHPTFDTGPQFWSGPSVPRVIEGLKKHFGKAYQNCTVVAKNCKFDITILAHHFGIYPPYTIDIEDLTRYFDARMSHKLKDVAPLFGLTAKGDTNQFKGQHWAEMDHAAMKEYCLQDVNLESALFQKLLPIIDNPKFELDLARHTLNLWLKPELNLDLPLAEELETKMIAEVDATIDRVRMYWPPDIPTEEIRKILRGRKEFPLMLQRWLKGDALPTKIGKVGMIPALAKNDEACKLLLGHSNKAVRDLVQARLGITSWPSHAKRVQGIINQARCSDGKIRVPLKYYGGHTGRWSGSEGVNLQNLGGKGRGTLIHPLIGMVRGCLTAPTGCTLAIVDSAQIEARALAWLSGQDDLVEGFANGEDIYSEFASRLFGSRVWKPASNDDSPEAKIAGIRRGFGKDAILGCGYGMGANKFYSRCRENDALRPLFDSGQYDWDLIDRLIRTYRTMYFKIPEFWATIEKCFRFPIKYPGETTEYKLHDRVMLRFAMQKSSLVMTLPSGRKMFYRHAHLDSKGKIKDHYSAWWGGSITENIIQALSRDLLGYWLLECEKQGIHIVHHSHDELVGCVGMSTAPLSAYKMIAIMSTGPDWAEGLPLSAEGCLSERYKK